MATDVYKIFQQTRPRGQRELIAVIVNNDINLVKGAPFGITLPVDGIDTDFTGAEFTIPEVSILESDETEKGSLTFYRIGFEVREKIKEIGGRDSVPIRIMTFLDGETGAQSDFTLAIKSANLTPREASFKLTTENLERQARANQIFDPEFYPAIRFT